MTTTKKQMPTRRRLKADDRRQLEVGLLREMELEEVAVLESRTYFEFPNRRLTSETFISILVDGDDGARMPAIITVVHTQTYILITVCLGAQIMTFGCQPEEPLGRMRIMTPDNCCF